MPFVYGRRSVDLAAVGKRHLAVVARVLVDLADDDPDVLVAERRDAGRVLVAVGDELEQAGRDARLDDADAHAVAEVAIRRLPSGVSSTASPGLTWASLRGFGRSVRIREAGLAGLLDEDRDRRLAALLGRHGLLAGVDEQDPQPVDVALGDAVRRVERERRLVVLAGRAELAQLPERLREAVLGLGVRPELEQLLVRLGRLGPLGGRRLGDRLVGQLPLHAGLVDGAVRLRFDFGEGHGRRRPFGKGEAASGGSAF